MELTNLISSSSTVDIYRCGDCAVKLFQPDRKKTDVLYDALTQARIEETGLPVPSIHEVSVVDGRWAISMDLVEGKTLADLMREDSANMDRYIEMMVDLHILVHQKTMPRLRMLKDKLHAEIEALTELDNTKKYELLTRLNAMRPHTKLCHGKFSPENIIINEKGTYLVDWLDATRGNASADVANTFLLFSLRSPDVAEKYLNLFCKKTDTQKRYVQEWLPIVAAARLSENHPEEAELLHHWLDVVQYE